LLNKRWQITLEFSTARLIDQIVGSIAIRLVLIYSKSDQEDVMADDIVTIIESLPKEI
jgi:hypothetical protein